MAGLTGWHLLVILGVIILLFGATKLPALAKGIGQSINVFKKEMGEGKTEGAQSTAQQQTAAPVQQTAAPVQQTAPVVNPAPSAQPLADQTKASE